MPNPVRTGSEAEMYAAKRTAELDATALARLDALERHKSDILRRMVAVETWKATVPGDLEGRLNAIERCLALCDGGDAGGDGPPLRLGSGPLSH